MALARTNTSLLSALPEHLSASLFSNTKPVRLKADEVLFLAGDAGDGCYRVEDGLLKVTMVSRAGTERILAFLGRHRDCRRIVHPRRIAALGLGGGGAPCSVELS